VFCSGRFEDALTEWDAALLSSPRNAVLHEQKAQVLLELDRVWEAVQAALQATQARAEWDVGFLTLGRAQLALGEFSLAEKSLQTAWQLGRSEEAETELDSCRRLLAKQVDEAADPRQIRDHFLCRNRLPLSGITSISFLGDRCEGGVSKTG
jgi:predicted Zn-dependent protease